MPIGLLMPECLISTDLNKLAIILQDVNNCKNNITTKENTNRFQ